jgi:probable HAF family extracellular repeat protein
LDGTWSRATAINDRNLITGQAYTTNNFEAHAFRLSNGTMIDLGTLGDSYSSGLAINNSGTVVGYTNIPDISDDAFLSQVT